ncbi:MAG: ECF-type sigma factor [bacterium]|nr:ECF-type sigma factor [bacterium]
MTDEPKVARMLGRLSRGESVESELSALVYDDLRRMADGMLRRERVDHTLQATALVHEAWMRLANDEALSGDSAATVRQQFLCMAATAMRRILVEHARARMRHKRGGGRSREPLTGIAAEDSSDAAELLDLDEAVRALTEKRPQAGRIAELRIYGGFSTAEAATAAGVGLTVAKKEWAVAQALLGRWLRGMPRTE